MLKDNQNYQQKKANKVIPKQGCGCKKKAEHSNMMREKKLQELKEKINKVKMI